MSSAIKHRSDETEVLQAAERKAGRRSGQVAPQTARPLKHLAPRLAHNPLPDRLRWGYTRDNCTFCPSLAPVFPFPFPSLLTLAAS